jgi:hypothetical protein
VSLSGFTGGGWCAFAEGDVHWHIPSHQTGSILSRSILGYFQIDGVVDETDQSGELGFTEHLRRNHQSGIPSGKVSSWMQYNQW